jgi:hypothetical protein
MVCEPWGEFIGKELSICMSEVDDAKLDDASD